jgi:predicted SnoaL-like aldol condensation-catalyzing enzyme
VRARRHRLWSGLCNRWNHFDVIRVENGLIKEHWDEAVIAPPRQ